MKLRYLTQSILIISLLSASLPAQAPDTLWTKLYGSPGNDYGYCLDITNDNGYIIVGSYFLQEGNTDFYMIKTDENGDSLWTRTYGGDHYDAGHWVYQTPDNGYLVAGIDRSFSMGENDIFLFKTDSTGYILWSQSYGGEHEDGINEGQPTFDGGYIFAGYTASFGNGSMDAWLLRLDANGDTLWTKTYGGEGYDFGTSVIQTPDEGFLFVCNIHYTFNEWGLTLIKTDANGDSLWTRRYCDDNEIGVSIIPTSDNAYLILANTLAIGDEFDIQLTKIEDNGDILWMNIIGGLEIDLGNSIQETADNGFIICGMTGPYFDEDIYIVKTDALGDTVWSKAIAGTPYSNDLGSCIRQTSDGGYILTGSLATSQASQDVCLIKIAPDQVGIDADFINPLPMEFSLFPNYPNPFNASTAISYDLPQASVITLDIYDILGRKVETLVNKQQQAGYHQVIWNAKDISTGMYFYKLQAGDYSETKKMVLLK